MKKITLGLFLFCLIFTSFLVHAQTWSALKRLTWNTGKSWNSVIAIDAVNRLHVVWRDDTAGGDELYYKRSTNTGTSWSAPQRLTWNTGPSLLPDLAVDLSYRLHIVWVDNTPGNAEIFYKRSTDGGISWLAPNRLTWNSRTSSDPAIAADTGNSLHVVWEEYYSATGNFEIFYKRSTNAGANWSAPQRLTWIADWSLDPDIAADSGTGIHLVYSDKSPGNIELFYKRSTNSGVNWSAPKRLTWDGIYSSFAPSLAIDSSNRIHIVWYNYTGSNTEIFYKQSTDNGNTWSTIKRLTWMTSSSANPTITSDSGSNLHIVWNVNLSGNKEIFYKNSTDLGTTWSAPYRLTWIGLRSEYPSIASDSSNGIHVVWENTISGNDEICYKNRK